jgi:hypothetical protein
MLSTAPQAGTRHPVEAARSTTKAGLFDVN